MDLIKALAVIDSAVERTKFAVGANKDVGEACKFLLGLGIEREALVWFWKALHGDNEIGRSQNAWASRNRINLLLMGRLGYGDRQQKRGTK